MQEACELDMPEVFMNLLLWTETMNTVKEQLQPRVQ